LWTSKLIYLNIIQKKLKLSQNTLFFKPLPISGILYDIINRLSNNNLLI